MAAAATFLEQRPGGAPDLRDFSEHAAALLACGPDVIVVMGPQSLSPRLDWAIHGGARVGGAVAIDAGVSGVILPASPDIAQDVMEAFEADGLPVQLAMRGLCGTARGAAWALARESFQGTTLVIEPPRTRPERSRAAGSALALALAARGLSWGLLGYGSHREIEAEREFVDGARAVERILGALGA